MNQNNKLNREIGIEAIKQLKQNWHWYLMLGIGLVILGTLALLFSYYTTIFSVIYLGLLFIIIGLFTLIKAFKVSRWSNFFLNLFLSVLYIISGFFILYNPLVNALTLTLLLALFFIVSGILKFIFSFAKQTPHKGWLAFNGIITIILGILIWKQWPISGLWVIGMLVGIDTIFYGWTWIILSLSAKNIKIEQHHH